MKVAENNPDGFNNFSKLIKLVHSNNNGAKKIMIEHVILKTHRRNKKNLKWQREDQNNVGNNKNVLV